MEKFNISHTEREIRLNVPIPEGAYRTLELLSRIKGVSKPTIAQQMILFAFANLDDDLKAKLKEEIQKPESEDSTK